eukprot:1390089-Prymnesium_polylepis.1
MAPAPATRACTLPGSERNIETPQNLHAEDSATSARGIAPAASIASSATGRIAPMGPYGT